MIPTGFASGVSALNNLMLSNEDGKAPFGLTGVNGLAAQFEDNLITLRRECGLPEPVPPAPSPADW